MRPAIPGARPPRPQEARPHPRRRRLAGAVGRGRDPSTTSERGAEIRPPRGRRRRRQPVAVVVPAARRVGVSAALALDGRGDGVRHRSASRSSASSPTTAGRMTACRRVSRRSRSAGAQTSAPGPGGRKPTAAEPVIADPINEWTSPRPYLSNAERSRPADVRRCSTSNPTPAALGVRSPSTLQTSSADHARRR